MFKVGVIGSDNSYALAFSKLANIEDWKPVNMRSLTLELQIYSNLREAGIPTWIDKPFTVKISDAKQLIDATDRRNTLLTGGSTCKYAYDVLMLKNAVENDASVGDIMSGALNFRANPDSEYGGLFFYGAHTVEMLMTIFGCDVKSVIRKTVIGKRSRKMI